MPTNDAAASPPAPHDAAPSESSEWVPIMGRVIKGSVAYYHPRLHRIRITKRWHGAKVTEDLPLPPPAAPER